MNDVLYIEIEIYIEIYETIQLVDLSKVHEQMGVYKMHGMDEPNRRRKFITPNHRPLLLSFLKIIQALMRRNAKDPALAFGAAKKKKKKS